MQKHPTNLRILRDTLTEYTEGRSSSVHLEKTLAVRRGLLQLILRDAMVRSSTKMFAIPAPGPRRRVVELCSPHQRMQSTTLNRYTRKQEFLAHWPRKPTATKLIAPKTRPLSTQTRSTEDCDILAHWLRNTIVRKSSDLRQMLRSTPSNTWETNNHVLLQKLTGVRGCSRQRGKPNNIRKLILILSSAYVRPARHDSQPTEIC